MRYKELIEQMTLEEKASLTSGKDFWQTQEIERLGIPSIFLADGPHGLRKQAVAADHLGLNPSVPATCFPTAATLANSWSEELGREVGACLGKEAAAQHVNVLLGPGLNIKRNPLCGRNFEYYSEDPYLAGKMAAALIQGVQTQGVSACAKHFAANNQEVLRMTIDTLVDQRTLREIYLTAFEIAVKEGETRTLMTSYNKLNGTYTNEHQPLLRDILRGEWGYTGCIVTDWGGSNDRVDGLAAGNELEMPTTGGETDKEIVAAVRDGRLREDQLDEALDRLLGLAFATDRELKAHTADFNREEHHLCARRAAEESIVLLKNEEDILPLKADRTVAVIGDFAGNPRYQGAGSSIVNPTRLESFQESAAAAAFRIAGFEPGFERYGKKSSGRLKRAVRLAKEADTVLLFLGLDEVTEAEGQDRRHMALPENQVHLLDALWEVNRDIVVVLSCGSAVEMPWIDKAKGVVHGYLSGQAGAGGLLNVLSGQVNPSGKLAESYPLRYEDTPSAPYFPGQEATVEYREGPYVGYRYFDTADKELLFPFGYGLSYTTFRYSDLEIEETGVSFRITNSGERDGAEIAQLYIGLPGSAIFRPCRELKGFAKIYLKAGESRKIRIDFDDKAFRYFNVKTNKWEIEEGEYEIAIGASSRDLRLRGTLSRKGTGAPLPYDRDSLKSYFSCDIENIDNGEFEKLYGAPLPDGKWDRERELGYNDTIGQCRYAKGGFARFGYRCIGVAYWFLKKIGKRGTANLMMMSVYNMPFRGIARMTGGLVTMPMVDGLLMVVNGRFFKGLRHFWKEWRKLKKSRK